MFFSSSANLHSWLAILALLANISSFLVALLIIRLNFLQLNTDISFDTLVPVLFCVLWDNSSTFSLKSSQVFICPCPKSGSFLSIILLMIASIVCCGSSTSAKSISILSLSSSYAYLNFFSISFSIYSIISVLGKYEFCLTDVSAE